MAVVKVTNGVVVQTWKDVGTVQDAVDKYGLNPNTLVEGNHPVGTEYDGNTFQAPFRPAIPEEPHPFLEALWDLAEDMGPSAMGKMTARFGPRV